MQKVHNITHTLVNLWNKVKRDSSAQTFNISKEDIVVFLVGPTGSGKSWFAKEATKSDLVKVSRDSHPCTSNVQAIRCELTDEAKKELQEGVKGIVFVDTPSFLTERKSPDARKEIKAWLNRTEYQPRDVGVIYIHRVETDPALEPMQRHLQQFATTVGADNLKGLHLRQRVHIVASYDKTSSNLSESKIRERRTGLGSQMESLKKYKWQPSIHQGLFQGDPEVAWGAVEELFKTGHGDLGCLVSES